MGLNVPSCKWKSRTDWPVLISIRIVVTCKDYFSVFLATNLQEMDENSLIKTNQFQCLPIISGVKAPISVLGAKIDQLSPPELLKQFEEVLSAKPEVVRVVLFSFL